MTSPVLITPEVEEPSSPVASVGVPAGADSAQGMLSPAVSLSGVLVSGVVVAALVSAAINIALARYRDVAEERARIRTTCAEAFETAMQYKEFPYAIRRRRADEPEAERVRLSTEMRSVQAKLSYYEVWTKGESPGVGDAYETLLTNLRRVAGKACKAAWQAPAVQSDEDMNLSRAVIDLAELREFETAYVTAVQLHLQRWSLLRRWSGLIWGA